MTAGLDRSVRLGRSQNVSKILVTLGALTLIWTLAGLVRVVEQYSWNPLANRPPLLTMLRWRLWDWWFWIPVTVGVRATVRRRALNGPYTIRFFAIHAGVACLLVVVHRLYSVFGWIAFTGAALRPRSAFAFLLPGNVLLEVVTYAAIVAACIALESTKGKSGPVSSASSGLDDKVEPHPATAPPAVAPVGAPRIEVKLGARRYFVPASDVLWVEADGYCARLHTRDRAHVVRASLRELERRLAGHGFLRAHRSALVSAHFVTELRSGKNGSARIVLENGHTVNVSRDRVSTVRRRLVNSPALPDPLA